MGQEVEEEVAHSRSVCMRCFNLIDEIDSLEEQLNNKKQVECVHVHFFSKNLVMKFL